MRITLTVCLAAAALWQFGCQTTGTAAVRRDVNLEYIEGLAKALAQAPYDPRQGAVPQFLADIDYNAYRVIRFDPSKALWASDGLLFRVEFFHPGNLFTQTVKINEFTSTHEQEIPFNSSFFDYGPLEDVRRRVGTSMGYAGFRIRYPINRTDVYDEVAVFLGASYFRVIGQGQVYGLSARGLAIDTGLDVEEEFPRFREFWLGKPEPDARELTLFALLDSKSVTGAYRFVLRPGKDTEIDVTATLFMRQSVRRLGLTPFSSMFLFGEHTLNKPEDFRPEVHDSDGVLILEQDGRATWRPLTNPPATRTSIFSVEAPVGYGIMQRDRDFEHYQDIVAAYHLRPSAWVTPTSLPEGTVTLFEYHTPDETHDNVAMFYEVASPPQPGEELRVEYTLSFTSAQRSPSGIVRSTRMGRTLQDPNIFEFVVDFEGAQLAELAEVEQVVANVEVSGAELVTKPSVQKNPYNNTWRMFVYLRPGEQGAPVELRGQLILNDEAITEVWSHQWIP